MSHIFISYARKDKVQLDKVLAWLKEKNFADKEIWFDKNIESGNNWSDEIIDALDNAFVVLVLVTKNLLNSNFCTIEWAYGLGQGIPILPLQLEEVNFSEVPPPLAAKQLINGIERIPDDLAERFQRLKSTPPEVYAINKIIFDTVFETHRRLFILDWLGEEILSLTQEEGEDVIKYFTKEAGQAQINLEKLMLDKAFALNGKQHRLCWQLVDFLWELARIQVRYNGYLPKHISEKFLTEWMPAFSFFDNGWWEQARKVYFEYDLEDEANKTMVLVEMIRAFPMIEAWDVNLLIEQKSFMKKNHPE